MTSFQPFLIAGSDQGLETDKRSFMLPDKAFPILENAYVWRDRVKKRESLKLLGRLRRVLTAQSLGNTAGGSDTLTIANIFTTLGITGEDPDIEPNTLDITIGAPDTATFTDVGDGTFTVTGSGLAAGSYINYATGTVVLKFTGLLIGAGAITCGINYYPKLPVMGIIQRERSNTNFEQTLVFDTKYCYISDGTVYSEYLSAGSTTWNGSTVQFFSGINYRGSDSNNRQLFVTNFNLDATGNPIRYTDGTTWTDFEPSVSSTQVAEESLGTVTTPWTSFGPVILANFTVTSGTLEITVSNGVDPDIIFTDENRIGTLSGAPNTSSGTINYDTGSVSLTISPALTQDATVTASYKYEVDRLYSCKKVISFYGRLLAFNTFEGASRATATQYFNRLRFSQIGSPIQNGAFDSTIFGRGGFIDAPTNEEILDAIFYKNVLIVFMETSTWQVRYQGDYGLPFIWERISSDYGSESPHSSLLFDYGVITIGNRAIVAANAQNVKRIDDKIRDLIFRFRNENSGTERVHGIRDFQRELAFWCFNDSDNTASNQVFPNKTLLYNYVDGTWAIFRNNITTFGYYDAIVATTWDSTTVTWDDESVTWDDVDSQTQFPFTISGNQQGFVHLYGYTSVEDPSVKIESIDRSVTPPRLTVTNHNFNSGDILYLEGMNFIDTADSSDVTTDLNLKTYKVRQLTPYNVDIFEVLQWDVTTNSFITNFSYTPANSATEIYIGEGTITLMPRMKIVTKDSNPFLKEGKQVKLGYIDFLTDETTTGQVNIRLLADTTYGDGGNLIVGQQQLPTYPNPLYPNTNGALTWNRFYSTLFGQFIAIEISYSEAQMADQSIQNQSFTMNALIMWIKSGGRLSY